KGSLILPRVDVHAAHDRLCELDPVIEGLERGEPTVTSLLEGRAVLAIAVPVLRVRAVQSARLVQRPEPQGAPGVHKLLEAPVRAPLRVQGAADGVAVHDLAAYASFRPRLSSPDVDGTRNLPFG